MDQNAPLRFAFSASTYRPCSHSMNWFPVDAACHRSASSFGSSSAAENVFAGAVRITRPATSVRNPSPPRVSAFGVTFGARLLGAW